MVSVGMFLLLNSAYITASEFRQMEPLGWLCGTFFLLSMGFASAWMFSTAVSSLIALTVACCVTAILGKIVLSAIVDDTDALRGPLETTGLGLFGLAAAVATIFFGQRAFVATSVFSRAFWRSERRPQYASPQLWTLSPSSSLIWQIGRQNSFIWSGLFLIVALSGALFLFYLSLIHI